MSLEANLALHDGKIFVSAYTGIGDAILCGPILRSLNKLYPGRILYPENSVLKLYRDLNIESLDGIGVVGQELRRFVDFVPEDLIEILRRNNIKIIFNLRRDRIKIKHKYENIANVINRTDIVLTDICEFIPLSLQTQLHTFDLCMNYFKHLGLQLERNRFGWLKESVRACDWRPVAQTGIGFYLGAGHSIKRMSPGFWHKIIKQLHDKIALPVILMGGVTEEEQMEGQRLSELLDEGGICHKLISGLSLYELTQFVSGFNLIVSCDTFMVHMAEALGVKVFGIYCSTNPKVYGPYHHQNSFVNSSFYSQCPLHNQIGNCDGWDVGCSDTPCKNFVDACEVAERILEFSR